MRTGKGRHCSARLHCGWNGARGFTYLALLALLAILSAWAAHSLRLGEIHGQRDAEEELLAIGREFTRALQLYAAATPAGLPRAPGSLEDLLRDPRYPGVVRHLRRVPEDPLTGKADWVFIRDAYGRLAGIHSASQLVPIRRVGPGDQVPESGRQWRSYSEWVFWGGAVTPTIPTHRVRGSASSTALR